jgi:hypothetical protein
MAYTDMKEIPIENDCLDYKEHDPGDVNRK